MGNSGASGGATSTCRFGASGMSLSAPAALLSCLMSESATMRGPCQTEIMEDWDGSFEF
jgi:hypothetical protein